MRKTFSQENLHPNISKKVLEYHKEVINEVEEAIEENQIVIVGMRWNDAVWQARRNFRRAEKKFKGLSELKKQIQIDIKKVKKNV